MTREIHLGSALDPATLEALAEFICGDDTERFPVYRSSSFLTRFFQGIKINATHDGSTRKWWVLDILGQLSPQELERVVLRLVDLREYKGNKTNLGLAVRSMNEILAMESFAITFDGTRPIITDGAPIDLDEAELLTVPPAPDEATFLSQQFAEDIVIADLNLDPDITAILQSRVDEAQACPRGKAPLATIFLLGSTLEGILLGFATTDLPRFMTAKAAPKDKAGTVYKIHDWKLVSLIDVSCELGLVGLDVKKFSHEMRDFRNYIHPFHQRAQGFSPTEHTADICWQVFRAAFAQLKASRP